MGQIAPGHQPERAPESCEFLATVVNIFTFIIFNVLLPKRTFLDQIKSILFLGGGSFLLFSLQIKYNDIRTLVFSFAPGFAKDFKAFFIHFSGQQALKSSTLARKNWH